MKPGHSSKTSTATASIHGCGGVTWEQWAAHTSTPSDSGSGVVPPGRVLTRSTQRASGLSRVANAMDWSLEGWTQVVETGAANM